MNIEQEILQECKTLSLETTATGGGCDYVIVELPNDYRALLVSRENFGSPEHLNASASVDFFHGDDWTEPVLEVAFTRTHEALKFLAQLKDCASKYGNKLGLMTQLSDAIATVLEQKVRIIEIECDVEGPHTTYSKKKIYKMIHGFRDEMMNLDMMSNVIAAYNTMLKMFGSGDLTPRIAVNNFGAQDTKSGCYLNIECFFIA